MKTALEIALVRKPKSPVREKMTGSNRPRFKHLMGYYGKEKDIKVIRWKLEGKLIIKTDASVVGGCKDGLGGPEGMPNSSPKLQLAKAGQAAIKRFKKDVTLNKCIYLCSLRKLQDNIIEEFYFKYKDKANRRYCNSNQILEAGRQMDFWDNWIN